MQERTLEESSRAAQRPSIALQLAGAEKVQGGALSLPRALPRYLGRRQCRVRCLGEHVVTLYRAHKLVLKPQREGVGSSIYLRNIPPFVAQTPQQERAA